jgi:transcriptional regulator with XRE-family HTH domain
VPSMPATAPGLDDRPLYDHDKLRAWRESAGESPTEAAARIGVSYPWLTRIERGGARRRPSLEMLHRLAAAYGHEAAELLTGITP